MFFREVRDLSSRHTSTARNQLLKETVKLSGVTGLVLSICLVDTRSIHTWFIPRPIIFKFLITDIDGGLGRSKTAILRAAG